MEVEIAFVREICEGSDFVRLVDGAEFRRLRDRNDLWLDMVLVADAVISVADELDREFAVRRWERDEFGSCEFFRGATLVGIDVGHLGADNSLIGTGKRLQAQNICAGAVEYKEDGDARSKMLFELADSGGGEGIVTVADDVSGINASEGGEDVGMDGRVVVAGKTAAGLHAEIL